VYINSLLASLVDKLLIELARLLILNSYSLNSRESLREKARVKNHSDGTVVQLSNFRQDASSIAPGSPNARRFSRGAFGVSTRCILSSRIYSNARSQAAQSTRQLAITVETTKEQRSDYYEPVSKCMV
jgi:hypothetical protein